MSEDVPGGAALRARHSEIYSKAAAAYDAHRSGKFFERPWLERLLEHVPKGGRVLDLGCGAGLPITGHLVEAGFTVTGLDFAPGMLTIARERLPDVTFIEADMRTLDLGSRFHGIVGWDSFFHLTAEEQRALIPRLAEHLEPGGVVLLTVGDKEGEVTGTVEGETVFHASLAPSGYALAFEAAEMEVTEFVARDAACDFHSVLLAVRR
ncbi:MAG: class I SAM-dependent methyltransferase [Pseudomonadota bacterium]